MRVHKREILLGIIFASLAFALLTLFLNSVIALPYGSQVTHQNTSSAPADSPGNHSAIAGNVTEISIFGYSTTRAWQGYFGNVTGVIQLADSADKVMYNWTDVNPRGEIYASRNGSLNWYYLQCFNYTANGTYCAEDYALAGNTSQCGMNLTQLNLIYNISTDDVDGANNTFLLNDHQNFYANNMEFTTGECKNMKVYNSTGAGLFDEVIMYEPAARQIVFSSILRRDANGFDGNTHDFEMLVLENGHGVDLDFTTYYFYLELGA